MLLAQKAIARAVAAALSAAGCSLANANPIVGALQTVTCSATGGTAPFTYTLYNQGGTQRAQLTGQASASVGLAYTANSADTALYCVVQDALAASRTSASQSISVIYNASVNVGISTTTPSVGQSMTLTATITGTSGGTYTWYWRVKPLGGSFGSWTTFGGSGSTQVTGAALNGETYDFYCTYSNAAGTTTSNTVTAVTPGNISVSVGYTFAGAGNPAYLTAYPNWSPAGTIQWYYLDVTGGGSWTAWTTGTNATSGTIGAGQTFQFYCTASNAAGTTTSNTVTVSG